MRASHRSFSVHFCNQSMSVKPLGLFASVSAEGYGPDDDEDVEEDEGNCGLLSVISHVILLGTSNELGLC